jgi:hypothetical protein
MDRLTNMKLEVEEEERRRQRYNKSIEKRYVEREEEARDRGMEENNKMGMRESS